MDDLLGDHFCAPYMAENHYHPARYYLGKNSAKGSNNWTFAGMKPGYGPFVGEGGKLYH